MTEKKFGEQVKNWHAPSWPVARDLEGSFVRLEPLDAQRHANALFEAKSQDDGIWDYLPYGPFSTFETYREWVEAHQGKDDPFFFAVVDKKTSKALGVMSFLRISPEAGTIEVGHINWSVAMQKTPLATEALFLMMNWVFEAGYRRFEWKCNALNMGSCHAAQRFGFSYEGIFRQATISKGLNRDTAWFACIDKEWPELKRAYATWLSPDNFDENGRQRISLSKLTRPVLVMHDPRQTSEG